MDLAHARLITRINQVHPWTLEREGGGGERQKRLSLVHTLLKEEDEDDFRWNASAGVHRLGARRWGIDQEEVGYLISLDVQGVDAQAVKDACRYYLATADWPTAWLIATRTTESGGYLAASNRTHNGCADLPPGQ